MSWSSGRRDTRGTHARTASLSGCAWWTPSCAWQPPTPARPRSIRVAAASRSASQDVPARPSASSRAEARRCQALSPFPRGKHVTDGFSSARPPCVVSLRPWGVTKTLHRPRRCRDPPRSPRWQLSDRQAAGAAACRLGDKRTSHAPRGVERRPARFCDAAGQGGPSESGDFVLECSADYLQMEVDFGPLELRIRGCGCRVKAVTGT